MFLRNTISDPICNDIATHLLLNVTGSFTCVAIFVEKSYSPEILAAMQSRGHESASGAEGSAPPLRRHLEFDRPEEGGSQSLGKVSSFQIACFFRSTSACSETLVKPAVQGFLAQKKPTLSSDSHRALGIVLL